MQDYYTPKGKHLTLADRRKKRKPIGSLSMLAFHHHTTVDKEPKNPTTTFVMVGIIYINQNSLILYQMINELLLLVVQQGL